MRIETLRGDMSNFQNLRIICALRGIIQKDHFCARETSLFFHITLKGYLVTSLCLRFLKIMIILFKQLCIKKRKHSVMRLDFEKRLQSLVPYTNPVITYNFRFNHLHLGFSPTITEL